ncbi:hypothetical protein QFZ77_005193 [Paenibacillus sp. V4I3]|uniref:hypothetical protein n=1 Tax=Paenibacillus sp. V4I3 TaxID=3042305 RepID=UPI00277E40CA|nr:hypothetical protein [Paenibacillus sp. V4I3]MDQ0876534.1 hypothetical protein [Paenibacillus sp. V4I3]
MFKRKSILLLAGLILVAISAFLYLNTDERKNSRLWDKIRSGIDEKQVEEVSINHLHSQKIVLNKTEQMELLRLVKQAEFQSSNRIGHGSTPDGNISINFKDKQISFSYLIGGKGVSSRFETSPKDMDPDAQFHVEGESLAKFLETKLTQNMP